ncbi:MAG: hypothetical protein VKO39_04595 [Cyanobacteriota bacterium]|nr:hypothetical protein [Cyanobacteriota bacterium]
MAIALLPKRSTTVAAILRRLGERSSRTPVPAKETRDPHASAFLFAGVVEGNGPVIDPIATVLGEGLVAALNATLLAELLYLSVVNNAARTGFFYWWQGWLLRG